MPKQRVNFFESADIDMLARSAGIDVARMRRDMADPAIEQIISRNYELAQDSGVNGTPAFLINGVWVKGFSDRTQMDQDFRNALRPQPAPAQQAVPARGAGTEAPPRTT